LNHPLQNTDVTNSRGLSSPDRSERYRLRRTNGKQDNSDEKSNRAVPRALIAQLNRPFKV
ncbi:MAG: hypothetical protein ABWZ80_08655, partial [Beijerinckiaceae bacterium]